MLVLNLKQLETFSWVARLGSFQAAASHLNATQPAISIRIRELERLLGVELFDRTARAARLTLKGRELLDQAERLLVAAAEVQYRIADKTTIRGVVRLGVVDVVALTWLPQFIFRLERVYPGIRVDLVVDATFRLRDLIHEGEIDLACVVGPGPGMETVAEPLGTLQLSWMASPKLGLPPGPLDASTLSQWPVISDRRGTLHDQLIREWFRNSNAEPSRINGCNSLSTTIRLTVAGLGVSLLAPGAVRAELSAGTLVVVPTVPPTPMLDYVILCSQNTREPAVKIVLSLALEVAAEDPSFNSPVSNRQ
jgi:DNA-binding transcriptional LysR family regulator